MKTFLKALLWIGNWLFSLGCTMAILGAIAAFVIFQYYGKDLPDYSQLAKYDPPTVTRLYAADGRVMAEYASEKRVFVPLHAIPKRVSQAFLSAEDKNFYEHKGVDLTGVARAVRDNIIHYGQGKSLVGGSTITQQVVKNFLLSNEKSIERKVKEAILAVRITRTYSKNKILELYLNEIYLGLGSYGVAAAAQNYFNKSLDELTTDEIALLAAQPKAPSLYDPRKNYERAKQRRDWIIERMVEDGYVSREEAETAKQTSITLRTRDNSQVAKADFFAEETRRTLAQMYGADVLYTGGLVVKTTLNPTLQEYADAALRKTLVDYDRRHGYRGPMGQIARNLPWKAELSRMGKEQAARMLEGQKLAVVLAMDERRVQIAFEDDSRGSIPFAAMKWTRRSENGQLGPEVKKPADIMKIGDVLLVAATKEKNVWDLQQLPEVNGALVALDPHTGRVLAMSGGYSYGGTEFNRVTQAKRQPGSAFKPFVYLAALENGLAPTTVIEDGPVEISQGENLPPWRPQNYEGEYLGPATLRVGLEKSRNAMTVRLTQYMGLDKALEMGKRFGIYDDPPQNFSIVLGSSETTLLRIANAYGMLANGGRKITPSIIERIDDRHGKTIYRRDHRACPRCQRDQIGDAEQNEPPPIPEDVREQMVDPRVDYQMISMLEGVAVRGTAARAQEIGKVVAGKTGTTNDSMDAWFVGFTPDLVVGVYVGFDKPRPLGPKETGGSVALPAFISFMKDALKDTPNKPFNVPPGIQLAPVDLYSGVRVSSETPSTRPITEAFIVGEPIYIPGANPEQRPARIRPSDTQITDDGAPMEEGVGMQPEQVFPAPPTVEADMPQEPASTEGLY